MMLLKACPKCGGDLIKEWEKDDSHMACLQCGRSLSGPELVHLKARLAHRARRAVAERQRDFMEPSSPSAPVSIGRVVSVDVVQ